ncbi:MAG: hypothetical protein MUP71_10665 [Candidatus Aminicenantes bacterium]|nr:hypothetical protein [Candidatus Aminicenantes bacterium]
MTREECLFCDGHLDTTLRAHLASIGTKVDAIPRDQFMNAQVEEVIEHILSEMIVEPLVIYEDRAEMEQRETKIDVSEWRDRNPFGDRGPIYVAGVSVSVSIPFTGDSSLWKLRPNQWQTIYPHARVLAGRSQSNGHIQIDLAQPADETKERFKQRLDEELKTIRFYVQSQNQQVNSFNANLRGQILAVVNARRDRLKKHEGLNDFLGIPLKRKEGVPAIEPVKIERKLVRPLPPTPKSGYKPEPGITDEDYSYILSVIRHEGRTFETTPKTFAVHEEEALRDILLAHLNGHYKGDATGEAFRRSGKTDIRIEDGNRAAFVAECKVWKGQKELSQAIDQLLGYLTWRDCKAAIIIFNKHNARFSRVIETIPTVLAAHRFFKRRIDVKEAGEWQFDMTSGEDVGRHVRVHVFAFNLFVG